MSKISKQIDGRHVFDIHFPDLLSNNPNHWRRDNYRTLSRPSLNMKRALFSLRNVLFAVSQKLARRNLQLADHKVDQKSKFVLWTKIRKLKSHLRMQKSHLCKLTPTLSAWLLNSHWTLKSVLRETHFWISCMIFRYYR